MRIVRYLIVLITAFIAGGRTVDAVRAWRNWHTWVLRDPSAAEGYRTFFRVDATVAAVSLIIAGLVWWLLRPTTSGADNPSVGRDRSSE
jgi:ABC-type uncharacterized transport system permease subunit